MQFDMTALFKVQAGISIPKNYAGGMNKRIRVIRQRDLFDQQSCIQELAVGAETAHRAKDFFSTKGMGRRVRYSYS